MKDKNSKVNKATGEVNDVDAGTSFNALPSITVRKITTETVHPQTPAIYDAKQDLYIVVGRINQIKIQRSDKGDDEYPVYIGMFEATPISGSLVGKYKSVKSAKLILPSSGGDLLYAQLDSMGVEIGKKISDPIDCGFLVFSEPFPKGSKYTLGCEPLIDEPMASDPLEHLSKLALNKFSSSLAQIGNDSTTPAN